MNYGRARVRAPALIGAGGWINTEPLTSEQLRGRVLILDFWTSCCVNCLHVLDELRPLEAEFADELLVIGIHSPKFAHEAELANVVAAVNRNEIAHPVLNDPDMHLWRQYAIKAWPTLVVVDPLGYVVAQAAGEGQVSALREIVAEVVAEHLRLGTLRPRPATATAAAQEHRRPGLRFPAKAVLLPAARTGRPRDTLLIADAGGHDLVEVDAEAPEIVVSRIGSGQRGFADGAPDVARFHEPNGLALLPPDLAASVGYDVVVADTVNHRVRGVRLDDHRVHTIVDLHGLGLQTITGTVPDVMSPWDVAWWPSGDCLVVAAAGVHLLLGITLDQRPAVRILAGTTVEGLRDGPALDGWLAQPSGLAVDGDSVWFVDAETSSLRRLDVLGRLHTAVGEGLFDFGDVDGPASTARLQHPLGLVVRPDGTLGIADTYNGAVRSYDPRTDEVSTVSTGLGEPSGLVQVGGELLVVESSAHRLSPVTQSSDSADPAAAPAASGTAQRVIRPPMELAPGPVRLRVVFTPAPGREVDNRFGPGTRLDVDGSPAAFLTDGAGDSTDLTRDLVLTGVDGDEGVLHVSAQAASCDHDPAIANPACYLARQDWGVPIRLRDAAATEVELVLLG